MDAFTVSITCGLTLKKLKVKHVFAIAPSFGFFQGAMPIIGWLAGVVFRDFMSNVTIGLHSDFWLLLSVATSIDAFAVGLSFSFLKVEIIRNVL